MIKSIDELEDVEIKYINQIIANVPNEDLFIAMHGVSPLLIKKFKAF